MSYYQQLTIEEKKEIRIEEIKNFHKELVSERESIISELREIEIEVAKVKLRCDILKTVYRDDSPEISNFLGLQKKYIELKDKFDKKMEQSITKISTISNVIDAIEVHLSKIESNIN